jgi:hypothetical protein
MLGNSVAAFVPPPVPKPVTTRKTAIQVTTEVGEIRPQGMSMTSMVPVIVTISSFPYILCLPKVSQSIPEKTKKELTTYHADGQRSLDDIARHGWDLAFAAVFEVEVTKHWYYQANAKIEIAITKETYPCNCHKFES